MHDQNVAMIRKMYGDNMYLNLLACHALGAGAYITVCQSKYDKPVEKFTVDEITEIGIALMQTDPYELAIKTLGYALDGNNKKCLDQIVLTGLNSYRKSALSKTFDNACIKIFMQVMFNAGITVVLRG